jgi:glycosyltransferase involved in cell wall biosynthesis
VPYRDASHPYAVLDAIAAGCQVVMTNAGGLPDLIPEPFRASVLCARVEAQAEGLHRVEEALTDGLRRALELTPDERRTLVEGLGRAARAEQAAINRQALAGGERRTSAWPRSTAAWSSSTAASSRS